jgi:hypothetical protein
MRYIIILLVSIGLAGLGNANASDKTFYVKELKHGWNVSGRFPTDDMNGACIAELVYSDNDGSYAQIVKDLGDQEILIAVHNTDWQITDAPSTGPVQMNSYTSKNKVVRSGRMNGSATNKNTVLIRHLVASELIDILTRASRIRLIMPGNLMNTDIILVPGILSGLLECIEKSTLVDSPKTPSKKPKGETL